MKWLKKNWNWIAAVVFMLLAAATTVVGINVLQDLRPTLPEFTLTLLLIGGLVLMIVVFAMTTAAFSALNLATPDESLGLPRGSIRAIIAVGLILIFAIQSNFIFREVGGYTEQESTGITKEIMDTIPQENIISIEALDTNPVTYNVDTRIELLSETSKDFGNQILTTVSTLAVAVSGFYFGARVASTDKPTVAEKADPLIEMLDPDNGLQGASLPVSIIGKDLQMPKTARLVKSKASDIVFKLDSLSIDKTKIIGTIDIPKDAPTDKWKLIVEFESGDTKEKEDAFTVNAPHSDAPAISSIDKKEAPNKGDVMVEITGKGFVAGSKDTIVELRGEGYPVIQASKTKVEVVSTTKIKCTFTLTDAIPGERDVVVINPDKKETVAENLFTIT